MTVIHDDLVDGNVVYVGSASGKILHENPLVSRMFFGDQTKIHLLNCEQVRADERLLEWLEHTLYHPSTPRNDLFHLRLFSWSRVPWSITSVPADDIYQVERFLNERKRRLTKQVVKKLESGVVREFPFWGKNFWYVQHEDGFLVTFP